MTTILLLAVYVGFTGLGVPNSLFGVGWPAIYPELGLPLSGANYVTLLVSAMTMLSSFLCARAINRFGYGRVVACAVALSALALLGYSVSGSLLAFCLFSIPLGIGAGAIDSGLNNFMALHFRATHMNFMHCAFGVGVALSPYLMSVALGQGRGWRTGFRWGFFAQTLILLVVLAAIRLFDRAEPSKQETEQTPPVTLRLPQMIRMPKVRLFCLIFFCANTLELTCGNWGSTYMVNSKGMSVDAAAAVVSVYYVGLTAGRFLAGLLAGRLSSLRLIFLGVGMMLASILLLLLPLSPGATTLVLFFLGAGIGPICPNINQITPESFGAAYSQSVMGMQIAAGYFGVMLMPTLFGFLAQWLGTGILPVFLLATLAVTFLALLRIRKMNAAQSAETV